MKTERMQTASSPFFCEINGAIDKTGIKRLAYYRGGSVVCPNTQFNLPDIIGRSLVNTIVQPVGIKKMSAGAPADGRPFGGVIIGKVVFRHLNVNAGGHIPHVLLI